MLAQLRRSKSECCLSPFLFSKTLFNEDLFLLQRGENCLNYKTNRVAGGKVTHPNYHCVISPKTQTFMRGAGGHGGVGPYHQQGTFWLFKRSMGNLQGGHSGIESQGEAGTARDGGSMALGQSPS